MFILRFTFVLCAVCSFVGTGFAQSLLPEPSNGRPLVERLSIDLRAHSVLSGRTYGAFGMASLSFPVVRIPSAARGMLFGHDVAIRPTVGMGSFYGGRTIKTPLPFQSIEGAVSVPVLDLSAILRSERQWVVTVTPFLGITDMRDNTDGSHRIVTYRGASVGTNLTLWDGVSLIAEHRWAFFQSAPFLRLQAFPSLGLGVSFSLGSGANGHAAYRRMAETVVRKASERMTLLEDSVDVLRASVALAQRGPDSSGRQAIEEELRVIRSEVRDMRAAVDKVSRTLDDRSSSASLASLALFRAEDRGSLNYDAERLPPTTLIRVEKRLFEGEDLVEEMYLKSVLAILNSYDNYVWEVAYRDRTTRDGVAGIVLAKRICQFFELYNARLSPKLTIRYDDSIRPEFEIRCLGLAR